MTGLTLMSALTLGGCYNTPTQATGASGPSGATVTITASGVQPTSVTVAVGQSVTFVNNDSTSHDILENPGQASTCDAVSGVSVLSSGQQRLTIAFTTAGTCTFYDYNQPLNANFNGTITVH